jgi:hypothetical protein
MIGAYNWIFSWIELLGASNGDWLLAVIGGLNSSGFRLSLLHEKSIPVIQQTMAESELIYEKMRERRVCA